MKKRNAKTHKKARGQPGRGGEGAKWQGRDEHVTLHFNPKRMYHLPLPLEFFTRFTASGSCYTGFGAGTGDYNWSFPLNSFNTPFSAVTTGVTWNGIVPSTFQCPGVTSLFSATMYDSFVVYDATLELDIVNQSVADSVVATLTPSLVGGQPASIGAALSRPLTKQMAFAAGRTYRANGDYPFIQRMSISKLQGLKKGSILNDTSGNFVGTFSGGSFHNPPSNFPWVLNVETGDNSNLVSALEIRVRVTYFVKCFGLQVEALQVPKPPKRSKVPGGYINSPEEWADARARARAGWVPLSGTQVTLDPIEVPYRYTDEERKEIIKNDPWFAPPSPGPPFRGFKGQDPDGYQTHPSGDDIDDLVASATRLTLPVPASAGKGCAAL